MRRACRRSVVFLSVTAILTGTLSGCASRNANTIKLGEWISLLDQKAGLQADHSSKPYYLNIPEESPYYEAVQAAVDWSVLECSTPFDPEQVLTREWTAYTLVNLSGRGKNTESRSEIRDLSASVFPDHVSASVASGLFQLDSHDRFCPKQPIDKTEALNCLTAVINQIDSGFTEVSYSDIEFDDAAEFTDEVPESVDEEQATAVFQPDSAVKPGQYFVSEAPAEQMYRINKVETTDNGVIAEIEPAHPETVFKTIDAADSFIVDFTTATITDAIDGTVIQEGTVPGRSVATMMSGKSLGYARTHDINGYHISYSVTATGIKAEVTRQTPSGLKVFGNLNVSSVKPSYRWKTENGSIKDGFFKLEFTSSENLGAEIKSYKEVYGDFSQIDPKNFLGTIRNLFQEKKDSADITIPLANAEIPVPGSPLLTVGMQLQLTIRASGKAQLALTQDNCIGMEIRDGHMRQINHSDMNAEVSLRANTGLLGGVAGAMKIAGMPLADIATEAGVTAEAEAVVHLYDKDNNHTVMKANDIPTDLVDDLADGNEGVLTCADINAHKTMDIKLNSSSTLAGRAGLGKTITLADENNGELIPGLNGHLENGHYVPRCTRKDRLKPASEESVVESDQIRIESYSMIADPGEKKEIKIKAIPAGYRISDLVITSDTPSVAAVSGTTVTAVSEGAAIIRISTPDGKYTVNCSILVRHKS